MTGPESPVTVTFVLAPRFTTDWLDSPPPELNVEPGWEAVVVRETSRAMTMELGPKAVKDLRARAHEYTMESLDPEYRGLVASARAVLRQLQRPTSGG